MPRTTPQKAPAALVLAASAALLLAAGCAAGGTEAAASGGPSSEGAGAVPAGVAGQYATVNKEIAGEGGETTSGEWRIGYIVEPAEPWFENGGNGFSFREPAAGETHHIEIVPFEAKSGRIVPDVPISVEVLDSTGKVVDAKKLNFYYAEFFHYANNFSVPTAGRYTLRATLTAPSFNRHGERAEQPPLTQGATVEFADVELAG